MPRESDEARRRAAAAGPERSGPVTAPDDGRLRTAAAFAFGWAGTICIFVAAMTADRLLSGVRFYEIDGVRREIYVDSWDVLFIAAFVTVYVLSTAWWAYALVAWFARRGAGSRSWLAYCKAGLAASVPYFVTLLCISYVFPGTAYWLAGLLSSLAYASIGYWLVERGWPWQWRRRNGRTAE